MIYRKFSRKYTREQNNVLWVGKTWREKMPTLVPACALLVGFRKETPTSRTFCSKVLRSRANAIGRKLLWSAFKLLISCMFLQSIHFPTNSLSYTTHLTHIKTPTCFGTQLPSSGSKCTSQSVNLCFVHIYKIK